MNTPNCLIRTGKVQPDDAESLKRHCNKSPEPRG
jgi:hypothetical protein